MSGRAGRLAATLALALALGCALAAGIALGSFHATAASGGNLVTAAPDFVAPRATATTIARSGGSLAGAIAGGGAYFVYAEVVDSGNPASGVGVVSADVSALTSGQTSVALDPGSYTAGGVSYNRRSTPLVASPFLAEGSSGYSLTMADAAGNVATEAGFVATVDDTPIAAADVQTENGSGTSGRADEGDTITYAFSEPPDPESILSHWDGAPTDVVVQLENRSPEDTVTIYDEEDGNELPLGTLYLGRKDYTNATRTFGARGTPSTMTLSGDLVTITLGRQSGNARSGKSDGTMEWHPASTPTDAAGNQMSTDPATESGPPDREF